MMQLGEKVETNDSYWVFGRTYFTVREQPEQKAIDHVSFCYQIKTLSCWVSPNKNECVTYVIIPTCSIFTLVPASQFSCNSNNFSIFCHLKHYLKSFKNAYVRFGDLFVCNFRQNVVNIHTCGELL